MFLTQFFNVAIINLLAAISPGPDFTVVTRNSLSGGRRAGILTALGIAAGLLVHCFYGIVGVTAIVASSPYLLRFVQFIGASYLIYLGIQSLRGYRSELAKRKAHANGNGNGKGGAAALGNGTTSKWIKNGFLTNVLNPKAGIFLLSVFTQVINTGTALIEKIIYGFEIALIALLWFSFVSIAISHSSIRKTIKKIQIHFEGAMGVILIAFGLLIFVR